MKISIRFTNPARCSSGMTVLELLIIAALITIVAVILVPNFLETGQRARPITKGKSSFRALATALESYFIDHGEYPAMRPLRDFAKRPNRLKKAGGYDLFTIEPGRPPLLDGLTTPVAYIQALPDDPMTPEKHLPFAYYTNFP